MIESDTESPHVYQNLEFGFLYGESYTFRLLTVYPDTSDLIRCSLSLSTDFCGVFKALSYEWGTEPATEVISIDGKAFRVRPNLYALLRRLQSQENATVIWIDAICVNQDNIPERNQQVRLMSMIYREAQEVIVWLGKEPLDACNFRDTLIPSSYSIRARLMRKIQWRRKRRLPAAYLELANRSYWGRAWVIQEYVLANSRLIWSGPTGELPDDFLINITGIFRKTETGRNANRAYQAFIAALSSHEYKLDQLIWQFRNAKCSDPRDRLYALLGIYSPYEDGIRIEPDYSIDMDQLCSAVSDLLTRARSEDTSIQDRDPLNKWTPDQLVCILRRERK